MGVGGAGAVAGGYGWDFTACGELMQMLRKQPLDPSNFPR